MDLYPYRFLREKVEIISLKIPKAGKITIYTSGWPHTQNKLAQSISIPPLAIVKNCEPNIRSNIINANATVRTGNANTIITLVIRTDQVNIGIFIKVMPGARILRIVAIKLIPVINVPIPDICSAIA
ncbi:hypothetical protein D3C78_1364660 [compost metagenome]